MPPLHPVQVPAADDAGIAFLLHRWDSKSSYKYIAAGRAQPKPPPKVSTGSWPHGAACEAGRVPVIPSILRENSAPGAGRPRLVIQLQKTGNSVGFQI
jgi:hypothetical protein